MAVLLDSGAYDASSHFAEHSLQAPASFGARIAKARTPDSAASGEPEVAFEVLRPVNTLEALLVGSEAGLAAARATVARLESGEVGPGPDSA
ncbi:hypothetical protein USB125703_00774 [Pseudoclavibacter triregionum]|nr:hypothetical protein USB125703_00774 [Pseudoclavibacter triregionum]